MVRNLNLNFSHSFKGKIWSLNTDDQSNFLVIEERNDSIMEAVFHIMDLKSLAIKQTIRLEENWWVSLVHVSKDFILFKIYSSDGNPDIKSIVCWDIKNEKVAWINSDFKNIEVVNNQLISHVEDEAIFFDLETGRAVPFKNEKVTVFDNKILKPVYYPVANEYFSLISRFIHEVLNEAIVIGAEYLEGNEFVAISYYSKVSKLANKLLVVDMNKNILLHVTLGKEITGIGKDTFFIQDNKLIFASEKTNFFIYQLP